MRIIASFLSSLLVLLMTVPLLVLLAPLWLVGIAQRLLSRILKRMQGRAVPWQKLMTYEPMIGWKPEPNMRAVGLDFAGNRFLLTTGEDGWRACAEGPGGADVLVFGDSFAFGFGASDKKFFGKVSKAITIKTIGTNGYNLVQELLLMEQYAATLKGRLVLWFVYHGNDLYDNIIPFKGRYRMPFVREQSDGGTWEIVTEHVSAAPWVMGEPPDYYRALADICSDTGLSRRALSACEFLLERGKEVCDSAGAQLIVVSLPDRFQLDDTSAEWLAGKATDSETFDADRPERALREMCGRLHVGFYTIKGRLGQESFIRGEVHWNSEGNRRMASFIEEIFRDNKY